MRYWIKKGLLIVLTAFVCTVTAQVQRKKVGCIGDSVTRGYGIKGKGQSYPEQLQVLLGDSYDVQNFGHSGATLLKQGHNPYVKTEDFQDAIHFAADIVIISLGLNDTDPRNWPNYGTSFVSDYTDLIDAFKSVNPKVEVYVCTMTPIFSGHPRYLSGTRDWFNAIQNLIPAIADANDAQLIDNYSPLAARIDLFEDYLHPDAQGAGIIAATVSRSLIGTNYPFTLHESLGSSMVLQRQRVNKIFGKGTTGNTVNMVFEGKEFKTVIDQEGKWAIDLPSQKAGGPYTMHLRSGQTEISLNDIWFGDVYLASGQSNMAFQLQSAVNAEAMIKDAENGLPIRLFKSKNLVETNPVSWDSLTLKKINDREFFAGSWQRASRSTAGSFSAVAYAFAAQVAKEQGIPIGIIEVAVGGSNTESWIPMQSLAMDNLLATYIHNWRHSDFVQDFCRTRADKNLAFAKGKNQQHPYTPAYNFEAGIQAWTQTQLTGVLWYQGESNAHNIEHHEYLFAKMVPSWRECFGQELPFYVVQLSSIERPSWGAFRDSQRLLGNRISKVYTAISLDLGDPKDVHPKEKILVGQRLANLAAQHQYGKKINADSPQPSQVKQANGEVIIRFSAAKTLHTRLNEPIEDLRMIDVQGKEVKIEQTRIVGNKLYIKADLSALAHIYYGYSPYTTANLTNEANVPVSTFNIKLN